MYGYRNSAHPGLCGPSVQPCRGCDRHRQRQRLHRHPPDRRRRQRRRRHPYHPRLCSLAGREQHHAAPLRGLQPCGLQARLPHRPHPGRAGLSRAGDAGPARDDTRHRGDAGHPQRPHRHPAPQPLHRRRRQRPEPVPRLYAAGAGPGHHPEEHHRPSRQARRLGPERHRLVPQVYRQRGVQ